MPSKEPKPIEQKVNEEYMQCLFGTCQYCSKIIDGKGIHIVETYEIYKPKSQTKCHKCKGKGTISVECPHCDGFGEIEEDCENCEDGLCWDEDDVELIGKKQKLVVASPNG